MILEEIYREMPLLKLLTKGELLKVLMDSGNNDKKTIELINNIFKYPDYIIEKNNTNYTSKLPLEERVKLFSYREKEDSFVPLKYTTSSGK